MAIYFHLVRNLGLKKPELELWTVTVGNKRPAEIQTKCAIINTQHLNVFTSVPRVAAPSNRHHSPLLRSFNHVSKLCDKRISLKAKNFILLNVLT